MNMCFSTYSTPVCYWSLKKHRVSKRSFPSLPRQVNMDLGISTAATTAACAANNALQSMASATVLGLDHAPEDVDANANLSGDAVASEAVSSPARQEDAATFAGPKGEGHSEPAAEEVVNTGPDRDGTG